MMENWNFTPVAIIYFASAFTSFLLSFLSWRMRPTRGTSLFCAMMFLVGIWTLASMLSIFSTDFTFKLHMLRFEYIGMAGAVYLWLIFIARYTQYDHWLKKWVLVLLAIIPVITIYHILRAPNDTYIHQEYVLVNVKGLTVFSKNFTGGFYLWTAYAYFMIGAGVMMLLFRMVTIPRSYRKQLFFLIPVVLFVILPNVIFITDNNPIEPYDPTPISLVPVGILFLLTIYFHKFLDAVPVAHNLILKNIRSGVIIIDPRFQIIELNPIAESIFGKKQNDLIGKNISHILPELEPLISNEESPLEVKTELLLGHEKHPYEVKIATLNDYSGIPFGKVIMLWDISDQKMALYELDAYARTVAHDLKTPLGHIVGYAKLLKEEIVDPEDQEKYLNNIIIGGEKMKSIVDGLLILAKIRNQEKFDMHPLDMEDIIKSVTQRLGESISCRNALLLIPRTWHNSIGNAIWIEEVWVNLISNSLKYGGVPPVIEMGSELNGNQVMFWVKDNGNGLTQIEQEEIFNEFSRIHPNKDSIKGYGLGLPIVQRIICKLGGEVGVKSEPGLGSTFFFTLQAY